MDIIVEEENKEGAPDEYVVEAVIDKRIFAGKLHYLIKWQGWPLEESTWEPEENCAKCENLIQEYEKQLKRQREADASGRQVKSDESSSSSGPEIISDYEKSRKSRGRKKKKNVGQRKRASRSKNDKGFLVDDDEEDNSDLEKKRKPKKRRIKKENHGSGYLSTDFINGESTSTLDSDSSSKSKKLKKAKVIVQKEKKTRLTRENEAIKQYLGGCRSGVNRVRSRDASSAVTNEDLRLKKIVSSTCAKENETKPRTEQNYSIKEEVVQQQTIEDKPLNQPLAEPDLETVIELFDQLDEEPDDDKPTVQPHHEFLEQSLSQENSVLVVEEIKNEESNDHSKDLGRTRRISSSSSTSSSSSSSSSASASSSSSTISSEGGSENYERKYFGWERGKTIVQVIDWFGYKDKILHLVQYEDGEQEYVDDYFTCKNYPVMVFEMYHKQINGQLDEDQKMWMSFGIQRFQEFEAIGLYEEEDESSQIRNNHNDEESDINDSGQEDVAREEEFFIFSE